MSIGSGVLLPGVVEIPPFPILRPLAYTTGLGYRPTCDYSIPYRLSNDLTLNVGAANFKPQRRAATSRSFLAIARLLVAISDECIYQRAVTVSYVQLFCYICRFVHFSQIIFPLPHYFDDFLSFHKTRVAN